MTNDIINYIRGIPISEPEEHQFSRARQTYKLQNNKPCVWHWTENPLTKADFDALDVVFWDEFLFQEGKHLAILFEAKGKEEFIRRVREKAIKSKHARYTSLESKILSGTSPNFQLVFGGIMRQFEKLYGYGLPEVLTPLVVPSGKLAQYYAVLNSLAKPVSFVCAFNNDASMASERILLSDANGSYRIGPAIKTLIYLNETFAGKALLQNHKILQQDAGGVYEEADLVIELSGQPKRTVRWSTTNLVFEVEPVVRKMPALWDQPDWFI